LDSESGETVWQVAKDTYFYFSALGQWAYVGNEDGYFYAYDLETGEEVWQFEGGSEVWFGPAVTENTVYVGHSNGLLYALDAQSGEKRWEFETGNWAVSDALVSDGVVYFSDCNHEVPRQEGHLYALEAETGAQLWEYAATGTLFPTPVLGDNAIYIVLSASILALSPNETTTVEGEFDQCPIQKPNELQLLAQAYQASRQPIP
jgi:outer membrane protein assembly factor BamB